MISTGPAMAAVDLGRPLPRPGVGACVAQIQPGGVAWLESLLKHHFPSFNLSVFR